MKKLISLALAAVLALGILSGCGKKADAAIQIAVPNDTTNEARALLLLEANGIIKLKDGAGITATKNDIAENPHNVEIVETEAAQIPNILKDVDYAVINSNYAINAGLNPVKDSLAIEGSASAYANILAVKEGNESSDKVKALVAALESQQVAEFDQGILLLSFILLQGVQRGLLAAVETHGLDVNGSDGDDVGAVFLVEVIKIGGVLEVVGVHGAVLHDGVGHNVVVVGLNVEGDVLFGKDLLGDLEDLGVGRF